MRQRISHRSCFCVATAVTLIVMVQEDIGYRSTAEKAVQTGDNRYIFSDLGRTVAYALTTCSMASDNKTMVAAPLTLMLGTTAANSSQFVTEGRIVNAKTTIRIKILYGTVNNTVDVPFGTTVEEIAAQTDIPKDLVACIAGQTVSRNMALAEDCTLAFTQQAWGGQKGGDFASEDYLLRLGATAARLEEFCNVKPTPEDWHEHDEKRYFRESAILPWLFGNDQPLPTLDSVCQEALEYFGKTAAVGKLSLPQRFQVVANYWNTKKKWKPARIRDEFRKIDSPDYSIGKIDKPARELAKQGIYRGKELLDGLQ